ncbi:hypothetical protein, partial [Stutzerimonas kunmingensis]|uniref:hypothetical protein n=1 Tax=Stutzerimonas kunmingensis TaxID=1211807 RepID=UPI0028A871BD
TLLLTQGSVCCVHRLSPQVLDASSGEAYYRFDMRISGLLLGACLGKWIGGYRRTYCDGTG